MYKIEALKELRDYLIANRTTVEPKFDMESFAEADEGERTDATEDIQGMWHGDCMTSACLARWSVIMDVEAGRGVVYQDMTDYSMERYVEAVDGYTAAVAWNFIFDGTWSNDLDQAMGRIAYAINNNRFPEDCHRRVGMRFAETGEVVHV